MILAERAARLEAEAAAASAQADLSSIEALIGRLKLEIEFATGSRMRITGAVDKATLMAAIAALADGRRR